MKFFSILIVVLSLGVILGVFVFTKQATNPLGHGERNKQYIDFLKSTCSNDPSFDCITEYSISLLDLKNNPLAISFYPYIANMSLIEGSQPLSEILLRDWPDREKIKAFKEKLSKATQYPLHNLQSELDYYSDLEMRLLYLIGAYEKADKLLAQSHVSRPNGEDFGAIASLVKRGDLDKGLVVAQKTLAWRLEGRDPREGSSAIMHCNSYGRDALRAESMGALGLAFIEKNQNDKAYEVSRLLKTYIDNKAYGQKSFCHLQYANASFSRIMRALILNYAEQKNNEKVHKLINEQVSVLIAQNPKIKNRNFSQFEQLGKLSAAVGMREPIQKLISHMQSNFEIEFTDIHNDQHDPMVVMLALAKQYDAAFGRMNSFDYSKRDQESAQRNMFLNENLIPRDEIKLNSLIAVAEALKDIMDKQNAMYFMEKAHSMMGHRKPEFDPIIKNLSDYINLADMYYDLGMKDQSKAVAKEVLTLVDTTESKDYRGGQITISFFGRIAMLIARHETVQALQAWSDRLPYFYAGHSYAEIGKFLVQEGRWDELDMYMPDMARVLSIDEGVPENWGRFTTALIDAKEFGRYEKFTEMVTKGNPEDKNKMEGYPSKIYAEGYVEAQYTDNQRWLMQDLIVENMKGKEIPTSLVAPAISKYVESCPTRYFVLPEHEEKNATKEDKMALCLLQLVSSYQNEREYEAKQQERKTPF